ncbi:hypothetical protein ACOSQ2_021925 [Xanthoceras sorbifolium]
MVWMTSLLSELGLQSARVPVLFCDNLSAQSLAYNPVFHARTKHIEIDVHFVREKVLSKAVSVQYVPTEYQIVDLLTKPLSSTQFDILRSKLTVLNPQLRLRGNVNVKGTNQAAAASNKEKEVSQDFHQTPYQFQQALMTQSTVFYHQPYLPE